MSLQIFSAISFCLGVPFFTFSARYNAMVLLMASSFLQALGGQWWRCISCSRGQLCWALAGQTQAFRRWWAPTWHHERSV